ncbi:MAG TPA: pyridoxamine 5'-phosphate oxidase family protein [Gemmatimonadaceae bacterium]
MDPTTRPIFRELSRAEIDEMLARHHVGRIAYAFRNRVDIEPIHYVYHDGWIYARTAPGSKITVLAHSPWVAFEVDEVEGVFNWRSVVLHTTVYEMSPGGTPAQEQVYSQAVELLRGIVPETFTSDDPTPERSVVIRMYVDEATGREASTSGH